MHGAYEATLDFGAIDECSSAFIRYHLMGHKSYINILILHLYRNPDSVTSFTSTTTYTMSPTALVQPDAASSQVQDPWILHRETLRQLYIVEKKTLKEVKATMENFHGFIQASYVLLVYIALCI